MAKDSAFIPTLKDGHFPLRPSQSYKLKDLIGAVNNLGDKLGGKLDTLIEKQDVMIEKQDQLLNGQREMVELQHDLLDEVKESRNDLKSYLDHRFQKLEDEVVEMRAALRAKGII